MLILITGSRNLDLKFKPEVYKILNQALLDHLSFQIIDGGALGPDSWANEWAKDNQVETKIILPEYKKFGKKAPLIRDEQMVKLCDEVIAFWDGESHGTKYTISLAKKLNLPIYTYFANIGEIK